MNKAKIYKKEQELLKEFRRHFNIDDYSEIGYRDDYVIIDFFKNNKELLKDYLLNLPYLYPNIKNEDIGKTVSKFRTKIEDIIYRECAGKEELIKKAIEINFPHIPYALYMAIAAECREIVYPNGDFYLTYQDKCILEGNKQPDGTMIGTPIKRFNNENNKDDE